MTGRPRARRLTVAPLQIDHIGASFRDAAPSWMETTARMGAFVAGRPF
jgi:hypothetical protein